MPSPPARLRPCGCIGGPGRRCRSDVSNPTPTSTPMPARDSGSTWCAGRRAVGGCSTAATSRTRSPCPSRRVPTVGSTRVYRRLAGGLIAGLATLGVTAAVARHDGPAGPVCFAGQQGADLRVGDRKLCGSAQVRRNGAVLQHGSILLERLAIDETDVLVSRPGTPSAHPRPLAREHGHAGGAPARRPTPPPWLTRWSRVSGQRSISTEFARLPSRVTLTQRCTEGYPRGHAMPPVRPPERVQRQLLLLVR